MESKLDTLHVIDYNHDLFMNFERNLFVQLQQDVLKLTDEDITPLLLLESMFQPEFTPLPDLSSNKTLELGRFGRRNIWHGVFPKYFSTWVFKNHREDSWLGKYSVICMSALHKIW